MNEHQSKINDTSDTHVLFTIVNCSILTLEMKYRLQRKLYTLQHSAHFSENYSRKLCMYQFPLFFILFPQDNNMALEKAISHFTLS